MDAFREFVRRNKLFLQALFLVAAFFGIDKWKTLKQIGIALEAFFDLSHTLFSADWWTGELVGIPWARVILFVVFVVVAFNALFTFRNRNRPISIISTDVNLEFHDGGARVINTRKQVIHANRPGIAAYFLVFTHDGPQSTYEPIQGKDMSAWLAHPANLKIESRISKFGHKRDVYFMYSSSLPYGWLLSLYPRWLLEWGPDRLPPFINKYLVIQWLKVISINEYNGEFAKFSASSTRYTHQRIGITLDFSHDKGLKPRSAAEISVLRRLANAVSEETATPTDKADVYQINVGSGLARDETITVTWERH